MKDDVLRNALKLIFFFRQMELLPYNLHIPSGSSPPVSQLPANSRQASYLKKK